MNPVISDATKSTLLLIHQTKKLSQKFKLVNSTRITQPPKIEFLARHVCSNKKNKIVKNKTERFIDQTFSKTALALIKFPFVFV